ncbi:SGNH/GDSL hydrolase family protein [Parendozoicomonas haliclonae]|uniref:GDSL-like Lipase/Acylhydrolase n=1 Tax=Parendozoicomonas haliclonae TaxID=1960125 RepID=A0A1X7ARN4_9GAMM|nr:GDSL-type esterase/lipase family protein [Parendozoicomonas haliclonae]SMA50802.1 GDSL-like Lipase/Acylhydrolase [Parendozoicomonas haliclonae]
MKTFAVVVASLLAAFFGLYQYLNSVSRAEPYPTPSQCVDFSGEKFVALGDSLTHGRVSSDYVQILSHNNKAADAVWINAGINSRLAFNALQGVDSVIACQPKAVTILIGSNDVMARLSDDRVQYYVDHWQLTHKPDFDLFTDSLTRLVDKLQNQTDAQIAIFSLPPIGETEGSRANQLVAEHNNLIRQIAAEKGLTYLPLNETLWGELQQRKEPSSHCEIDAGLMEQAIIRYRVLGQSWDVIADANGLYFLTDCVHLNDRAAAVIARLAQSFVDDL